MKSPRAALILICALALVACRIDLSKDSSNSSVDGKGRCTDQFNNDHNSVYKSLQNVDASSPESVKAARVSCDKFRSAHAEEVTCLAFDKTTSSRVTASSKSVYQDCATMVDQVVVRPSKPSPSLDADTVTSDTAADCPQDYIDSVSQVRSTAEAAGKLLISQNIKKAQKACRSFKNSFNKSYSCMAVNGTTGDKTQVDSSRLYAVCEEVNKAGR